MYLITQTKQGISSIELGRRLGVTQTMGLEHQDQAGRGNARRWRERGARWPMWRCGACLGGDRCGGKTGSPVKKPIVAAVQTSDDGRPRRIKLRRIADSRE